MPCDASRGLPRAGRLASRRDALCVQTAARLFETVSKPVAPYSALIAAVLWMSVGGAGVAGLLVAPPEPSSPVSSCPRKPVAPERIEVPLASEATPGGPAAPATEGAAVERVAEDRPPAAPEVAAMAAGANVAFAIPVAAPARLAGKAEAGSGLAQAGMPGGVAGGKGGSPVAKLTFGRGAGVQPAPAYPRAAVLEEKEGAVTVRFAVDKAGRVMVARAVSSSGHAILDEAAVTTVRRRWRFSPGPPRVYEVDILFRLER